MPIRPPRLDDRSYDDLVEELLARIPAHTPEWTDPRPGDPGRTMVELFAWLADTILYRVNFIPERQRLAFLNLLGLPLRPARPATGIVSLAFKDLASPSAAVEPITLKPYARVGGPVDFETRRPVTVLPVLGTVFMKRKLREDEEGAVKDLLPQLAELYELGGRKPVGYVSTPAFPGDVYRPRGLNLVSETVDKALWIGLFTGRPLPADGPNPPPDPREVALEALGRSDDGRRQVLSIGVVPVQDEDNGLSAELVAGERRRIPVVWEILGSRSRPEAPLYLELEVQRDDTEGLTRAGVVELVLPDSADVALATEFSDARADVDGGVGPRPPRIDDEELADQLITWIRLRPTIKVDALKLSWVGINAVEIDQRRTLRNVQVGEGSGQPDLRLQLPVGAVERQGFALQVAETGRGWVDWSLVEQIGLAGPDDRAFMLDDDEGILQFGDGVRGRIPEAGQPIRVVEMRAGGGEAGNLPPGQLKTIAALRAGADTAVTRPMEVVQPLPTTGGAPAESLEEAERRVPDLLRHRDRAVTATDFVAVAADTPGVQLGRVEVLKEFKPHQRTEKVPGVVSVMVLPRHDGILPPNPRPSRHTIEAVHDHLSARVPLSTELYVIGCEYKPLGMSVGFELRDGYVREDVINAVRLAVRRFLWPLFPGGPFEDAHGWPLLRPVRLREIEVAVARVPGVDELLGMHLFERDATSGAWKKVPKGSDGTAQVDLARYQLPELLRLVVVDDVPPESIEGTDALVADPFADDAEGEVPIPVVPEMC